MVRVGPGIGGKILRGSGVFRRFGIIGETRKFGLFHLHEESPEDFEPVGCGAAVQEVVQKKAGQSLGQPDWCRIGEDGDAKLFAGHKTDRR